jgi:hypothetical protein
MISFVPFVISCSKIDQSVISVNKCRLVVYKYPEHKLRGEKLSVEISGFKEIL